jgi:putative nucleotidyltransferase with HDIG domain
MSLFQQSDIPTRQACLELWEVYAMQPQIRAHSLQVARVSCFLAGKLKPLLPDLDLDLVEAGALLHDIAKSRCLAGKGNHVLEGRDILNGLGYAAVAGIVAQHVRLDEGYYRHDWLDEAVMVHYADKRVLHDAIVDLETRFDYLKKTYGRTPELMERIEGLLEETRSLEERIFSRLPFPPQDLKALLSE